jgi:hypothetical protein
MIRALFGALFSRLTIMLIFWTITILASFQTMLPSFNQAGSGQEIPLLVGSAALAACALCYIGAVGFMSSSLARGEKGYRPVDLIGIASLALLLIVSGLALMIWSGFSLHIFDVEICGVIWALLGAFSAGAIVRPEDALDWI